MHDPFFFDRLMHAFTTMNSTPLSHAATSAASGQPTTEPASKATPCRALREAEEVVAAARLRERMASAKTRQPDDRALPG
jgi:hypothetical protein